MYIFIFVVLSLPVSCNRKGNGTNRNEFTYIVKTVSQSKGSRPADLQLLSLTRARLSFMLMSIDCWNSWRSTSSMWLAEQEAGKQTAMFALGVAFPKS